LKTQNTYKEFDDQIRRKVNEIPFKQNDLMWKRVNDQLGLQKKAAKIRLLFLWRTLSIGAVITSIFLVVFSNKWNNTSSPKSTRKTATISTKRVSVSFKEQSEFKKVEPTKNTTETEISNSQLSLIAKSENCRDEVSPIHNFKNQDIAIKPSEKKIVLERNNFSEYESPFLLRNNISIFNDFVVKRKTNINFMDSFSPPDIKLLESTAKNKIEYFGLLPKTISKIESNDVSNYFSDSLSRRFNENDIVFSQLIANTYEGWYLGGTILPVYSYRFLKSENTGAYQDIDGFDQNEEGLFNFNFGLDVGYNINSHFRLRSGVGITNYSSSFLGKTGLLVLDSIKNSIEIATSLGNYYVPEHDLKDENGNEYLDGTILGNHANLQKLKYLSIPISLEYGITRKRFRYFGALGFTYNRLLSEKMDLKIDGYRAIRSDNKQLATKNVFSQSTSLGIEYSFLNHYAISFNPEITFALNKINSNSYLKSKPYWFGANLSFKYFF